MTPLRAQLEPLEAWIAEGDALRLEHWRELALYQDRRPLDVDWDRYRQVEAGGQLLMVTLRDSDAVMCGYLVGFIAPSLHYRGCTVCMMDVLYVARSHRQRWGGMRLMRAAEREMRRRGVQLWVMASKDHHSIGQFYAALGFEPSDTLHAKWIG